MSMKNGSVLEFVEHGARFFGKKKSPSAKMSRMPGDLL